MSKNATGTAIERKVDATRSRSGGGAISPERALGQALAKAAQHRMNLPLRVMSARQDRMLLAEVIDAVPDRSLIVLLQGP